MLAEEKAQAGPFEMHSGIEMQDRRRPMSMQELEGTMPARAELDARSARSSMASGLSPSVRQMQDEELARESGRDGDEASTDRLRPEDGEGT